MTISAVIALLAAIGCLILATSLMVYHLSLIFSTIKGAPYVALDKRRMQQLIALAQPQPHHRIAELGSGDGRLARLLAVNGAQVDGYEINPFLYLYTKIRYSLPNLTFYRRNILQADLSQYNLIIFYLFPAMAAKLQAKLQHNCQPGTTIISVAFPFPDWPPTQKHGTIYIYQCP